MKAERLLAQFERVGDAPDAIPRLRRLILDLAVRGKLVKQDPNEEPAEELLKRIAVEKDRLVEEGEIKKLDLEPVSPNEVWFEIPELWVWTRIGTANHVEMGQSPPSEHYNQLENGLPFFQGKADFGLRYPSPRYWCTQPKKLAMTGDILISIRAPVGPTNIAAEECCIGRGLAALRPYESVEVAFMLLSLKAFESEVEAMGFGSTFVAINKKQLTSFPIPLPPLAEQHRIVTKVDELMALCDQLEAAQTERETKRKRLAAASLARLNEPDSETFPDDARFALDTLPALTKRPEQIQQLRRTILNLAVRGKLVAQDPNDEPAKELLKRIATERNDLIAQKTIRREKSLPPINADEPPFNVPNGWEWVRIGDAVIFTQYGTSTKAYYSDQGVPVLAMGNIQDGQIIWQNEKRIPKTSEELPALYLKKFDLLYNRTNSIELVGKTGIYLGEDGCRTFASYLIRIRVSLKNLSAHYLNLAMNTPQFRETQIVPLIKKETGQANVNGTALKHMLIPLPPLSEQHRIVAKVDELMRICDELEASLTNGEETQSRLLDSLLAEAISA